MWWYVSPTMKHVFVILCLTCLVGESWYMCTFVHVIVIIIFVKFLWSCEFLPAIYWINPMPSSFTSIASACHQERLLCFHLPQISIFFAFVCIAWGCPNARVSNIFRGFLTLQCTANIVCIAQYSSNANMLHIFKELWSLYNVLQTRKKPQKYYPLCFWKNVEKNTGISNSWMSFKYNRDSFSRDRTQASWHSIRYLCYPYTEKLKQRMFISFVQLCYEFQWALMPRNYSRYAKQNDK